MHQGTNRDLGFVWDMYRYHERHAVAHFEATRHRMAIDLTSLVLTCRALSYAKYSSHANVVFCSAFGITWEMATFTESGGILLNPWMTRF